MANEVQEAVTTAGPYGIAGAITFAAIKLGPPLKTLIQLLYAIWEQREVKLEQEHRRDRKRRRVESTQPPIRGHSRMPSLDAAPVQVEQENTDMVDVREYVRKRAPQGFRPPRPGTHHDGDGEG